MRSTNRNRRAAAAVELAMMLPFVLIMFVAAVDFARVFSATQVLVDAAHSGALYASGTALGPSSPGLFGTVQTVVCAAAVSLPAPLALENIATASDTAANTVTVTVEYDFPMVLAVLEPTGSVRLRRSVTMRVAPRPGD